MKKLFCILLTAVMLIGATVSAIPASAAGIEDHLITHWDFSDYDEEKKTFPDKASKGTADTLTVTGTVTVDNGLAEVAHDGESKLTASGGEETDLYSFKNTTVVMRMKITATSSFQNLSNGNALTAMLKTNAFGIITTLNTSVQIDGYTIDPSTDKTKRLTRNTTNRAFADETELYNEFRTIVVSNYYDEATGNYIQSVWVSKGENPTSNEDFIATTMTTTDGYQSHFGNVPEGMRDAYLTNTKDIELGTFSDNRTTHITYDDIKIYDTAFVMDAPAVVGAQAAVTAGSFDVRFIGKLNVRNLKEVGFKVSAAYTGEGSPKDLSSKCTKVYSTISANYGEEAVTAASQSANYLYALTVKDIPLSLISTSETSVVFTVTPYCITASGNTFNGTAKTFTVTYVDSEIVIS